MFNIEGFDSKEIKIMNSGESDTIQKHKEFLFPGGRDVLPGADRARTRRGDVRLGRGGNKYLDCFGGVLTTSVGHVHPHVTEAIIDQVKKISHTSTLYANGPQSRLAAKLAEITPGQTGKILLHQQRHRSRRNGDAGGQALHRPPRDHHLAPQLQRALGGGADRVGPCDVEGPAAAGSRL